MGAGEAGGCRGHVAPVSPGRSVRGKLGRAGPLRPGARGSPALDPVAAAPGGVTAGLGLAGAQWTWEVSGARVGFLGPAQGLGTRALTAASAPPASSRRLCIEASPILLGRPRQRWHALGRPNRGHRRGASRAPRRHHRAIGQLGPPARCRGFLFLRLCEERTAGIVRPESAAASEAIGSLLPTLSLTAHTVGSRRRGYLVLSNPIPAGRRKGPRGKLKEK